MLSLYEEHSATNLSSTTEFIDEKTPPTMID